MRGVFDEDRFNPNHDEKGQFTSGGGSSGGGSSGGGDPDIGYSNGDSWGQFHKGTDKEWKPVDMGEPSGYGEMLTDHVAAQEQHTTEAKKAFASGNDALGVAHAAAASAHQTAHALDGKSDVANKAAHAATKFAINWKPTTIPVGL